MELKTIKYHKIESQEAYFLYLMEANLSKIKKMMNSMKSKLMKKEWKYKNFHIFKIMILVDSWTKKANKIWLVIWLMKIISFNLNRCLLLML